MRAYAWRLLFCTVLLLRTVCCYRLLFLPLSERTHMLVHLKLATVLAQRGHEVSFITPQCHEDFARQTASHMAPDGVTLQFVTYSMDCSYHEREKAAARVLSRLGEVAAIYRNVVGRADDILSDAALMQQLKAMAPHTDLLISDIFSFGMLLAAQLQLPHIDVDVGTAGSLWEPVLYGAEAATSFVPAVGTFFPTTGMGLWLRAANLVTTTVIRTLIRAAFWHPSSSLQQVVAKHNVPIKWPYTQALMVLVNSNFALEPPRAIPPNIQYIGPILPEPPQALQQNLDEFVSKAGPLGVVLVSFGGTLQAPLSTSRMLIRVIQALPDVQFVWKLTKGDQAALAADGSLGHLSNAFISNWLPQNDLLGHPKVRAFLTQGGYLSIAEAAYHGVPVLGLPFIPGQGELIRFAADHGRAIHLPADTLTKGKTAAVVHALSELLGDGSYHKTAQVVSRRLQAVQRPYKEAAADWVEYAAAVKDDGPFLHPVKLWQPWYQQASLDTMLLLAALAVLAALAAWLLVQHLWGLLSGQCSTWDLGAVLRSALTSKRAFQGRLSSSSSSSSCGSSSNSGGGARHGAADVVATVVPRPARRLSPTKKKQQL